MINAKDMRLQTDKKRNETSEDFENIINDIETSIIEKSNKGEYTLDFEVNPYVTKYMSKDDSYLDVSNRIKEAYEGQGFIVESYDNYKTECLKISWN